MWSGATTTLCHYNGYVEEGQAKEKNKTQLLEKKESLLVPNKEVVLEVNTDITKHMFTRREQNGGRYLSH